MINEDTQSMNESMTDHESKSRDLNGPTYKSSDQLGQSADHVVRLCQIAIIFASIFSPSNFRTERTLHFDHWPSLNLIKLVLIAKFFPQDWHFYRIITWFIHSDLKLWNHYFEKVVSKNRKVSVYGPFTFGSGRFLLSNFRIDSESF